MTRSCANKRHSRLLRAAHESHALGPGGLGQSAPYLCWAWKDLCHERDVSCKSPPSLVTLLLKMQLQKPILLVGTCPQQRCVFHPESLFRETRQAFISNYIRKVNNSLVRSYLNTRKSVGGRLLGAFQGPSGRPDPSTARDREVQPDSGLIALAELFPSSYSQMCELHNKS